MQNKQRKKPYVSRVIKEIARIAILTLQAPFRLADTLEQDLNKAGTQKKIAGYPKGSITFTLDDDFLQKDLSKRIDTLRDRNVRTLIEQYSKEIIKETLDKENYLIGYHQAYPQAIARINAERDKGLLDEFYSPVESTTNDDDKRNYKRG